MWSTSLAEAAKQDLVRRLQKHHLRRNHPANELENPRQIFELGTLAYVNNQRSEADLAGLHRQFGKLRDQLYRQVIDAIVAEILEGLQDRSFAGTTHAGDDDEFGRAPASTVRLSGRLGVQTASGTPGLH